jgi:hypothetical protein
MMSTTLIVAGRDVDELTAKLAGAIYQSNDEHIMGHGLEGGQSPPDEGERERNWRAKLLEYQINDDMTYPFIEAALAGARGILALGVLAKETA